MDPITQYFEEHRLDLTRRLTAAAFTIEEARCFLPEAARAVSISTRTTGVFQTIASLLSASDYYLPRKLDIALIARNTGLKPGKVTAGLHAIAPVLLKAFAQRPISGSSIRDLKSAVAESSEHSGAV